MDKEEIFSALNAKAFKTFGAWRNEISKDLLTSPIEEGKVKTLPRYKHDALFQKDQGHGLPDDTAKKREVLKMFGKGTATVGEETEELDEIFGFGEPKGKLQAATRYGMAKQDENEKEKIRKKGPVVGKINYVNKYGQHAASIHVHHNGEATTHFAWKNSPKPGTNHPSLFPRMDLSTMHHKSAEDAHNQIMKFHEKGAGHGYFPSKSGAKNESEEYEILDLVDLTEDQILNEIKKMSKHAIAVKAHKGENVGHGGFKKVEAKAAKEYGSEEAGKRVAAAEMWKKYAKEEYGLEEDDADEIFLEAINLGVVEELLDEVDRKEKRSLNQGLNAWRKYNKQGHNEAGYKKTLPLTKAAHDQATMHRNELRKEKGTSKEREGVISKYRHRLGEEEVDLHETLGKNATAKTYIDDFVHSTNSKFDGKSKKERIKMALGAYYGHHGEEVEFVDESGAVSKLPKANMSPPDRAGERNTRASKIATDKLKKTAKMNETPDLSDLLKKNSNLDETNKIPGTGISSRKEKHSMNKHVSDSRAIGSYKNTASIIKQSKRTNKQIERGTHKEEVDPVDESFNVSYQRRGSLDTSTWTHHSEEDTKAAARRIAKGLQETGHKVKITNNEKSVKEQDLNELSKKTLESYKDKAGGDKKMYFDKAVNSTDWNEKNSNLKKFSNRAKGVIQARSRLFRSLGPKPAYHAEEVELLDEHSTHSYEYKNVHGHSAYVHVHRNRGKKHIESHIPVIHDAISGSIGQEHPIHAPDCRGSKMEHDTQDHAEKELKKAGYQPNGHVTIDRYPDLKKAIAKSKRK